MDEENQEDIEFYITKLQDLLSKVIVESDEFKELKKLVRLENGELQLCVFSVLMDKKNVDLLKNMDPEVLQKWLVDVEAESEPLDVDWSDTDRDFLKKIRISI